MKNYITEKDKERSYSSHILPDLIKIIDGIKSSKIRKILDIGCGYGGILRQIGSYLGAVELYGIDIDDEAVKFAKEKGIKAICLDVEYEKLPYDDESFDLVISLGVFDYFKFWDNVISEIRRVLKPGGYVLISLPNLASYHNRLFLLFGYQPRDIEVSNRYMVGVAPIYKKRGDSVVGHVHTITANGFKELMERYGFETLKLVGVNKITYEKISRIILFLHKILSFFLSANLSKRFIYIGKKTNIEPEPIQNLSWWQEFISKRKSEKLG